MHFYDLVLWIHLVAGAAALCGFWLTAALRKGTSLHRRTGQLYLLTLGLVLASAVPIAIRAFLAGQVVRGTFLAYLVVVTLTPGWLAWRAIRDKRDIAAFTGTTYRALAIASLASGALVLAEGLYYQVVLLIGFSFVGIVTGALMLRFAAARSDSPRWWLAQHYGAIIGCGAATHIAFLNIGATRLLPSSWGAAAQNLGWFAPIAVAAIARVWLDRRYGIANVRAQGSGPLRA